MSHRFREVQYFRQWWVWLILTPAIIIAWFSFVQQIIFGIPYGTEPGPDIAVWIVWLLVGILIPFLFWRARLEVRVHDDRLEYYFFPFVRRSLPLSKIKRVTGKTYNPLLEYGGWGIRYGGKDRGWGYNVSGSKGIYIECHDGKCFLLGSQDEEKLADILNQLLEE